jgi:hypothetical protein
VPNDALSHCAVLGATTTGPTKAQKLRLHRAEQRKLAQHQWQRVQTVAKTANSDKDCKQLQRLQKQRQKLQTTTRLQANGNESATVQLYICGLPTNHCSGGRLTTSPQSNVVQWRPANVRAIRLLPFPPCRHPSRACWLLHSSPRAWHGLHPQH